MDKERLTYYTAIVSSPLLRQNGVIFPRYNIVVTPYNNFKTCKKIVVRVDNLPNQLAQAIFFDPVHKLAYYRLQFKTLADTDLVDKADLPMVGQPAIVLSKSYAKGLITTNTFFSKIYQNKSITYLQIQSKLPQVYLGSLVTDSTYNPVGISLSYDSNERMQVLPVKYVLEGIYEIQDYSGDFAFRCPYCETILTEDNIALGKCAFCGEMLPQELYSGARYIPDKNESKIEQILLLLNIKPELARLDHYYWEITKHDTKILLFYDKKQKALVAYSQTGSLENLDEKTALKVMQYLLEANSKLKYLTLSTEDKKIFLSTFYMNPDYIIAEKAVEIIRELIAQNEIISQEIEKITGKK